MRRLRLAARMWCIVGILATYCMAQGQDRVKIAEGEYAAADGDLGIGHIETEVFQFRESWILWRTPNGDYEVEGERAFESPKYFSHLNPFWIQLTHDFHLAKIKEFARLQFRRDSDPLTCDLLANELRCNSGAKDPTQSVDVQIAMDRPYGVMWPVSAFSLGSLTRAAGKHPGQKVPVRVVTLEEVSKEIPVLPVSSDGLIQYIGQSEGDFQAFGQSWRPDLYELDSGPVRKLLIWTSPEGLVLAAEQPNKPNSKLQLVSFKKFGEF